MNDFGLSFFEHWAKANSRKYKVFISHAWDYSEEYDRAVQLLNGDWCFKWDNLSVPEDAPLSKHPVAFKVAPLACEANR